MHSFDFLVTLPLPPPEQFVADIESRVMVYIGQYATNFLQIMTFVVLIRVLTRG